MYVNQCVMLENANPIRHHGDITTKNTYNASPV